jgi:hypothetical protein
VIFEFYKPNHAKPKKIIPCLNVSCLTLNLALICFIKPQGDDGNATTMRTIPERSATQFTPNEK